jgi:predicted porin
LQVSENANVGVTYQFTPKVSFSASVSATRNAAGFTPTTAALTALNQAFGLNQKTYSVLANVSYALTPFLGATLSYQFTTRGQSGLETNTNVALLTVNYAPY